MAFDPQKNPLSLQAITPQQAGWDATLQADLESLAPADAIYAGLVKIAGADASGRLDITAVPLMPTFTVGALPPAVARGLIYVSDEVGGAVPAFADGTNWRRTTDRAIVS